MPGSRLWDPSVPVDEKAAVIAAHPRRFSRESVSEAHRTHKVILRALIMHQGAALALVRSARALVDSGALVISRTGHRRRRTRTARYGRRSAAGTTKLPDDVQCLHVVKAWAALHDMASLKMLDAAYGPLVAELSKAYFHCRTLSTDTEALRGLQFVLGLDVSGSTTMEAYACGGPGRHHLRANDLIFLVADMIYEASDRTAVLIEFSGSARAIKWPHFVSLRALLLFARTGRPFGSTDPGAAIALARQARFPADAVVVLTDNDVTAGRGGSCDAHLNAYRREIERPIMGLVLTVSASSLTLFDPENALNGALDKHDAMSSRLMYRFAQLVRTRGNTA